MYVPIAHRLGLFMPAVSVSVGSQVRTVKRQSAKRPTEHEFPVDVGDGILNPGAQPWFVVSFTVLRFFHRAPWRRHCFSFRTCFVPSVLLASRVEVFPKGSATAGPGSPPRPSTIYFYIGLDCSAAADDENEGSCLEVGGDGDAGLVVVDSHPSPRRSLLVRGAHPQHGGFEMEAAVASVRDRGELGSEGEEDVTVAFVGRRDSPIVNIKQEVEKLHKAHGRSARKAGKTERLEEGPFVLPNEADAGSKMVLVQVNERRTDPSLVSSVGQDPLL